MQVEIADTLSVAFQNDARASSASRVGMLMSRMTPSGVYRAMATGSPKAAARVGTSRANGVLGALARLALHSTAAALPEVLQGMTAAKRPRAGTSGPVPRPLGGPAYRATGPGRALNFAELADAMFAWVRTFAPGRLCVFSRRKPSPTPCGRQPRPWPWPGLPLPPSTRAPSPSPASELAWSRLPCCVAGATGLRPPERCPALDGQAACGAGGPQPARASPGSW